jgi:hypothetical protein
LDVYNGGRSGPRLDAKKDRATHDEGNVSFIIAFLPATPLTKTVTLVKKPKSTERAATSKKPQGSYVKKANGPVEVPSTLKAR